MRNHLRITLTAAVAAIFVAIPAVPAALHAQASQRGQPRTPFGTSDLGKLHWLQGDWAGSSTDEAPLYARYTFTNDSTVDITYYRDAGFSQPASTGRLYLSVGRLYTAYGPARWGASRVDSTGVVFVPQVNVRSSLSWQFLSPDEWTATQRSGVGGHEHVTVYHMKRVR
ncbi:MAG TPA: hypothetical protein VN706_10075 [Gemmatimonadaceae bacterium]|nr:hypothetical protein [Gemmatimonadaceae bacterium]